MTRGQILSCDLLLRSIAIVNLFNECVKLLVIIVISDKILVALTLVVLREKLTAHSTVTWWSYAHCQVTYCIFYFVNKQ